MANIVVAIINLHIFKRSKIIDVVKYAYMVLVGLNSYEFYNHLNILINKGK